MGGKGVGGKGIGEGEGMGKGKGEQDLPGSSSLLLTCRGLRSPVGPVIVSLPARVVVNLLASLFAFSLRR